MLWGVGRSQMKTAGEIVDRRNWGPGPWDSEPDRVDFGPMLGCPAFALRSLTGAMCGYVGVPPRHPLYGKTYGDEDVDRLRVHGGVTYGDVCDEEIGICHVPRPGEPADVWWLGFDCAHGCDLAPGTNSLLPDELRDTHSTYKTVEYVRGECERLAAQLADIANHA
jgi:hypothetical protein